MITFSIDTTASNISIFLDNGKGRTDFLVDKDNHRHVKSIIALTDEMLSRNDLGIKDVDLFGINLGPGDFTGTRIGITVIKSFSWLSQKGVYGFNGLDVSAAMLSSEKGPGKRRLIAPVLDVRNDELYYCFFRTSCRPFTVDRIGDYLLSRRGSFLDDFTKYYRKELCEKDRDLPVVMGGNSLKRYKGLIEETLAFLQKDKTDVSLENKRLFTDASDIGSLVNQSIREDKVYLKDINPIYVRDFKVFQKDGK